MKNRYRCFLRSTSNKSATGRYMINLSDEIMKEIGWKINENLTIDIIKSGMNHLITIRKDETEYEDNK